MALYVWFTVSWSLCPFTDVWCLLFLMRPHNTSSLRTIALSKFIQNAWLEVDRRDSCRAWNSGLCLWPRAWQNPLMAFSSVGVVRDHVSDLSTEDVSLHRSLNSHVLPVVLIYNHEYYLWLWIFISLIRKEFILRKCWHSSLIRFFTYDAATPFFRFPRFL